MATLLSSQLTGYNNHTDHNLISKHSSCFCRRQVPKFIAKLLISNMIKLHHKFRFHRAFDFRRFRFHKFSRLTFNALIQKAFVVFTNLAFNSCDWHLLVM